MKQTSVYLVRKKYQVLGVKHRPQYPGGLAPVGSSDDDVIYDENVIGITDHEGAFLRDA